MHATTEALQETRRGGGRAERRGWRWRSAFAAARWPSFGLNCTVYYPRGISNYLFLLDRPLARMTLISLAARLHTFNWCVTSRHQLRSLRSTRRLPYYRAENSIVSNLAPLIINVRFSSFQSVIQISLLFLSFPTRTFLSFPRPAADTRQDLRRSTKKDERFVSEWQRNEKAIPHIIRFRVFRWRKDSLRSLSSLSREREW